MDAKSIKFDYNLKGEGRTYTNNKLAEVMFKLSKVVEEKVKVVQKQAADNDKEKESKGFIFTILSGTASAGGGTKAFTQTLKSEIKGRVQGAVTGAIAEATGLPAGLISGLVGGQSMKSAMKSYVENEMASGFAKATGLPSQIFTSKLAAQRAKEAGQKSLESRLSAGNPLLKTGLSALSAVASAIPVVSSINPFALDKAYREGGFGASVSVGVGIGPARVDASLNYSEKNGFSGSVGASFGVGDAKVGVRASYSKDGGVGLDASAQFGNVKAGMSYSQSDGFGVVAGFTNSDGTKTVGIGYSEKGGVEAYAKVSSDSASGKLSYSKAEGFGASVTAKTSYANASASFTQKSGLTVSVSKQMSTSLGEGFKASGNAEISYNTKTGFSASAGLTLTSTSPEYKDGKFTESDNGSISGNVKIDRTGATGSTSVNTGQNLDIASNLSSMESSLDTMAQENRDFNTRMAMNAYYDKYRAANPELANMSNDEIADLKKDLAKNHGVYTDEADGTSRESFGAELLGSLSDIGGMITGENRGGNQTGYIDASGNYHQRTCFTKGTKIKTIDGHKNIEDISIGDMVLSWNEKTGVKSYNKVTQLFVRKTDLIYKLGFSSGTTVETTWNHPFYIQGRGFVETKDLKVGDKSHTANGALVAISSIHTDSREETVYNFEVEGNHTYFVGDDGVLVHNDSYGNNLNRVLGAYYSKDPNASAKAELEKALKDPDLSEAERTKLKADLAREKELALKEGFSKRQGEYELSNSENILEKGVSWVKSKASSLWNSIPSWGAKSAIDIGSTLTGRGIKYGWGKNDPNTGGEGMDCSHFTNYATNQSRKEEGKPPIPYNTTESLLTSKDYKQIDPNSMKKGDQFVWRYDYTDKKGKTTQGGHTAFFNEKGGDKEILHSDDGHGPRFSNNYFNDPNWRKSNPQYSNIKTYAIRVK